MRGRLRSGDDPIAARNARTTSRNELAAARNEIERLKKGMLQLVEQLRVSNEELWHARATVENFRQREDERDVCGDLVRIVAEEIRNDLKANESQGIYGVYANDGGLREDWSMEEWVRCRSRTLTRFTTAVVAECSRGSDVADAARKKEREDVSIAIAIASLYRAITRDVAFDLGRRVSLAVKATGERALCDLISKVVPGARTSTAIDKWITKEREKEEAAEATEGGATFQEGADIIALYDNISKSYKGPVSARLSDAKLMPAVVSNIMVMAIKDPNRIRLQEKVSHAPESWKTLRGTPEGILKINDVDSNGDGAVETKELEHAIRSSIGSAVQYVASDDFFTRVGDTLEPTFSPDSQKTRTREDQVAGVQARSRATSEKRKQCTRCERWFPSHTRHCATCRDAKDVTKKLALPTAKENRLAASAKAPPTKTTFRKRVKRDAHDRADVLAISSTAVSTTRVGIQKNELAQSKDRQGERTIGHARDVFVEPIAIGVECIPPSNLQNNIAITKRVLRDLDVGDYGAKKQRVGRHHVFMANDLGAGGDENYMPKEVTTILPAFHEGLAYDRTIMQLVLSILDPEFLAQAPMLASAKNEGVVVNAAFPIHKTTQFLHMMQRVVVGAIWLEYSSDASNANTRDVESFQEWATVMASNDSHFESFKVLFMDVIPAHMAFRHGVRHGNPTLMSAARKALLPVLAGRGRHNYTRAIVRAIINVDHQVTPEVRQFIRDYGTYRGQGLDAKIEEMNATLKKFVHADSERGWQNGAFALRKCRTIIDDTYRIFGVKSDSGPETRLAPETISTERTLLQAIMRRRLLRPKVGEVARKRYTLLQKIELKNSIADVVSNGRVTVNEILGELRRESGTRVTKPSEVAVSFTPLTESESRTRAKDQKLMKKAANISSDELERLTQLRNLEVEAGERLLASES